MRGRAARAAVALLVVLAGCASTVDLAPPPPATSVPDVRGTWAGTWDGKPVQLVVTEQVELGDYAGLNVGSVQLLGRRRPSVTGVLTSTIAGAPVSAAAQGWLGYRNGRLTLLIVATTTDGTQQLVLTLLADGRWSGNGESSFRWGPHGRAVIARP